MRSLSNTKIIATIGPGTNTKAKIKKLAEAGTRIFRINSSHETMEIHKERIDTIRNISEELNLHIAILLDLQGPKIRVGVLHTPIMLEDGAECTLVVGEEQNGNSNVIPVAYDGIINDVNAGDSLLLDDGKITLEVVSKTDSDVTAKVVHGGELKSRKGLNIPGSTSSISACTPRDVEFIKFAIENNVDYLALSFVRNKEDMDVTRNHVKENGGNIPIIAKIEKPQALNNLDAIIEASDGVMVARGDLGIEISPEKVPIVQKQIIQKVNQLRKPIIVATQMLESMIDQPIPTRAEASDVANAIIDGTDAVMLSGETAVGQFPVKTIKMMQSIANNVEESETYRKAVTSLECVKNCDHHTQALARAIMQIISERDVKAIVAFTRTGRSAIRLSKQKPEIPIIAISSNEEVCRRLNLMWGIHPLFMDYKDKLTIKSMRYLDKLLLNKSFLKDGAKVVITGGLPFLGVESSNFIGLHQVGYDEENEMKKTKCKSKCDCSK